MARLPLALLAIAAMILIASLFSERQGATAQRPRAAAVVVAASPIGSCPNAPAPAQGAGYCAQTFAISNFDKSTVDMGLTGAPGFQLYFYNWYQTAEPANVALHGDHAVVGASSGGFGATLATAAKIAEAPFYRGRAFGGGGYFEATAAFTAAYDPANPTWEAPFWTSALEALAPLPGYQWRGQVPGYGHFFEGDVIEYFQGRFSNPVDQYSATSHDWWDVGNAHNDFDAHPIHATPASFSSFHRYGLLWKVATASSDGSACYYYDRVQQACTTWTKFVNDGARGPPPTGQPWEYGVIDNDHLLLVSGCANAHPCTISRIEAWQKDAAGNLQN
jgi:hypothetical protein